jgi:tRNA threonylcarbamoyladenosine biosynthesis protein TsaE
MSSVFLSHSPEETEAIGAQAAAQAVPGLVIAFTGDLGAGKTAFCRGFLRQLGYTGRVTSPTFAIVNEYETEEFRVCHFDMYRILDEDMLYDIGWDDYLDGDAILLIEWSENISAALPDDCTTVEIRRGDTENSRIITILGGNLT